VPGKRAEKGYALLREALVRAGVVGISKVVIRTRQYLAMVMPLDDALVLNLLRFPQEIVEVDEFKLPGKDMKALRITEREIGMAEALIKSMTVPWQANEYKDDFRDRLRALIEQRMQAEGGPPLPSPSKHKDDEHASTNVVDFMDLLNRSLKSGRRKPAEKEAEAPKSGKRGTAPAKRPAAKKAAVKKGASKKAATKKPAAKRASAR
jgi:DNA end-binding protein Ku